MSTSGRYHGYVIIDGRVQGSALLVLLLYLSWNVCLSPYTEFAVFFLTDIFKIYKFPILALSEQ